VSAIFFAENGAEFLAHPADSGRDGVSSGPVWRPLRRKRAQPRRPKKDFEFAPRLRPARAWNFSRRPPSVRPQDGARQSRSNVPLPGDLVARRLLVLALGGFKVERERARTAAAFCRVSPAGFISDEVAERWPWRKCATAPFSGASVPESGGEQLREEALREVSASCGE